MLLTVDLERLRVGRGDLVLDAGCGEGRHCFGCLERGARVVGLDLDFEALRQPGKALRARAAELGGFGDVTQGDAFFLPCADATFDRVICSEVMEHVHDYRGALRELWRVTKPEGTLALTIPTASSETLYLHLGDEYFESPGGHIRIFKPRELAEAMVDVGFDTKGVGFAHALHTPYWVLRSVMHLPDADRSAWVRAYREFLIRAATSPLMCKVEGLLNYVCPKSLILYGEKRDRRAAVALPRSDS